MIAARYSLEREIGRGGMGVVWLGRDEVLGRPVALKRIALVPSMSSVDITRAEREARLAARLSHPHVVAVYDLVVDDDAWWLVMEFVDGINLTELVQRHGAQSSAETARILAQAADALAAAHAASIVHRDVKPSNILLGPGPRVRLTDFGIARTETDAGLTQTGLVIGSPAYLAPEVAAGGRAGAASDVWSLGATAFYLLSGRPPYDVGDQLVGGLYRIVHDDPPTLAEPGALGPLLEATLVKDPAHRWPMERVRDFLADPPSGATGARTQTLPAAPEPAPAPAPATTQSVAPTQSQAPPSASTAPESPTSTSSRSGGRRFMVPGVVVLGVVLVALLSWVLVGALGGPSDTPQGPAADRSPGPSTSPSSSSSSASPSTTTRPRPARPTARGMRSFVRDYVAALSLDPDTAWTMLTKKFQRESGGLNTYRDFWSGVGDGEILSLSADPGNLVARYRVRFENFGTGERPTVLQLVFRDGVYLINGELTEGVTSTS